MTDRRFLNQLREFFLQARPTGLDVLPKATGTAVILTTPSKLSIETAANAAESLPLGEVAQACGNALAEVLAEEWQAQGLNPSQYAYLENLGPAMAQRLAVFLVQSEEFTEALIEGLRMRG